MNTFYNKYQKDIYSQNGEDGIIEELLNRLGITGGWACEFGAWDGVFLSNTFNLIKNRGFSGVLIEGDKTKFNDLLNTQRNYPNITAIQRYVIGNKNSEDSLDNILKNTGIPIDFDVLSIDIDGFDYHVWDSIEVYKPKIVIIEINSSIHPLDEHHIHTPGGYDGTAFMPTYKLGLRKGYTFVTHTGNMFFVKNELYDMLQLEKTNLLDNFRTNWLP